MPINYNALGTYANVTLQEFKTQYQAGNNIASQYYTALKNQAATLQLNNVLVYADQAARVTLDEGVRGALPNFYSASVAETLDIQFHRGSDAWLTAQYNLMREDFQTRQTTTTGELDYSQTIGIHSTAFASVGLPPETFTIQVPLSIIGATNPQAAQALFIESLTDARFFDSVMTDGVHVLLEAAEAAGLNAQQQQDLLAWFAKMVPSVTAAALDAQTDYFAELIASARNGVTYDTAEERSIVIDGQAYQVQLFSSQIDPDAFSTQRLVDFVSGNFAGYQPNELGNNLRFRAMAELYQRWTDDPNDLTADGYSFVNATNGGAMSKVLVHGQTAYGAMTFVTKGAFKILTVETIGAEGVPDSVQIITEETTTGTGSRSEPIQINYPENFNFTYLGGFFGGLLANQLDDGNVFKGVLYKTLLGTAGETMGTYLDILTADNGTAAASWAATDGVDAGILQDIPALKARLAANFTSALASVIGNAISDTLTDAVDIGGIGGEVLEVGLDTVTVGVLNEVLNMSFRGLDGGAYVQLFNSGFDFGAQIRINGELQFHPNGTMVTVGEHIELQVKNAIAAYIGARLAGEVISPESQQAAIFGSIGSGLAVAIATGALKASAAVQSLITAGLAGGPVGVAIAAFVGTVVGTFLGNALFGEDDEPAAWARISYNTQTNEYEVANSWAMDGGSQQVAQQMAQSIVNGLNAIIDSTGGTLRQGSHAPEIMIGYEGAEFRATIGGGETYSFTTPADAVMHAAFDGMKQFDLVGGYAVLMRAWHNSDATTIHEWKEDLEVAAAFQAYLANPTGIVALMLDKPESAAAQAWAAILNRVAELELHLPHERDLDGGWSEVLRARGDIDPNLIPDIEGGDIIMTDPVTGQEIRLEHVIGPGYEIVRVPGTDGNDIIQIIVDGPSIGYVDAGEGNDIINGSEQADILIGGTGDDTVYGHGGNDWLHGGQGEDDLDGGAGDDLVVGGPNNDAMLGGENDDTMYGSDGDDVIQGGDGKDFIYGGNGNDVLNGNSDAYGNKLYGEAGNDTLYGQGGDNMFGGVGDDTYFANSGDRVTITRGTGHDVIYGNANLNYITLDDSISINELWFQTSGSDLIIKILGEDQSITIKNLLVDNLTGSRWKIVSEAVGFEMGSPFNLDRYNTDVAVAKEAQVNNYYPPLAANNYASDATIANRDASVFPNTNLRMWENRLYHMWEGPTAEGGYIIPAAIENSNFTYYVNGTLNGMEGNQYPFSTIYQGAWGADDIRAIGNRNIAFGGAGNDRLIDIATLNQINADAAFLAHNKFYGDSGNDYIDGGYGNDLLVGGLGNDTMYGSDGNDEMWGGYDNDFMHGGNGSNILHGGWGSDSVQGGAGNDQLYGDEGDDTIRDDYGTGNNIMHGGGGNDQLLATGAGANTLYGEEGNDLLDSFTGQDSLSGGAGDDVLNAGAGNDMLFGDDGSDTLSGEDGDDKLSGGEGNDLIDGGQGNDTVFGQAGDDIFVHAYAGNPPGTNDQYDAGEGSNDKLRVYLTTAEAALPHVLADLMRFKATMAENQAQATATVSFWMAALGLMASNFEGLEVYIDGTLQNIAFNQITGTSGNDTLTGTSGHDYVLGAAGDDTLTGGTGDDYLRGGEGVDTINAGAGFNFVKGDAGDDQITGGNDQDRLEGGTGDDTLNGEGGDDHLEGQDGDDQLSGGDGIDTLIGGFGDDVLTGGEGNDTLSGQADDDTIDGQAGNDTLDGGSGNDQLLGGAGDDKLIGGEGHDTLRGGLGQNDLTGNNGADTFTWQTGDVDALIDNIFGFAAVQGDILNFHNLLDFGTGDLINDFVRLTENGTDTDLALDLDGTDNGANFTTIARLKNTSNLDTVAELFADGRITVTSTSPVNEAPVARDDEFTGVEDENITGNLLSDNGNGADSDSDGGTLSVQSGTFAAAEGGSVVISSNGAFVYTPATGFFGEDSFEYTLSDGQGGNDTGLVTLTVEEDNPEINGTSGDDILNGTTGADVINGLAGNDTLYGDGGNDTIDGGADTDTVTYAAAATGVTVNLATGTATDGAGGTDTLSNIERATGSAFADTITGTTDVNTLSGGNGNDTINGNGGADTLNGEDGDDVITGGSANDTISGGNGIDTVSYANATGAVTVSLSSNTGTGFGSDTLSGIENITGSDYNDNLTGDGTNNILAGGAGNDTLTGGSGNDTVDYRTATAAVTVNLATNTATGQGTDTLSGIEYIIGSDYADTLTGSSGKNNIYGGAGNDAINAGADLDNVYGGAGDDTIYGGDNSDTIYGDEGNDIIHGELGNDVIYGGDGNDTITTGDNNDTIYGGAGTDSIDGGGSNDTVSYAYDPSGVIASLATNTATDGWGNADTYTNVERMTGSAFNDTLTGSTASNIILGGAGNDNIIGNGGTDTLTGEDGDDFISGGSGSDTIDGGNGTDTVSYAGATSAVNVNLTTGSATGQGTDTLSNLENVIGSAQNDTLRGNTSANTLAGRGGADTMYGESGADIFLFEAATAYGASDTLADFSTAQGDKIDISDLLAEYDPLTELIEDFVRITTSGSNSILSVDANGGANSFVQIASITGVTGLTDEQALVNAGHLLVA